MLSKIRRWKNCEYRYFTVPDVGAPYTIIWRLPTRDNEKIMFLEKQQWYNSAYDREYLLKDVSIKHLVEIFPSPKEI